MERILLLIDPSGIKDATFDFAYFIAGQTRSKLTALFIQDKWEATALNEFGSYRRQSYSNAADTTQIREQLAAANAGSTGFSDYCRNRGVTWRVEAIDAGMLHEIVMQTRFADLMIIDSSASLSPGEQSLPTSLSRDILTHAECPVVVAPSSFEGVEEIVFTYDGLPSSVYAIRQFIHLFPQLSYYDAKLVEIRDRSSSDSLDRMMIADYLKHHYSSVRFETYFSDAREEVFSHFAEMKNAFVVFGAYGRSLLSSYFRKSTTELLLKTGENSLFISNR